MYNQNVYSGGVLQPRSWCTSRFLDGIWWAMMKLILGRFFLNKQKTVVAYCPVAFVGVTPCIKVRELLLIMNLSVSWTVHTPHCYLCDHVFLAVLLRHFTLIFFQCMGTLPCQGYLIMLLSWVIWSYINSIKLDTSPPRCLRKSRL